MKKHHTKLTLTTQDYLSISIEPKIWILEILRTDSQSRFYIRLRIAMRCTKKGTYHCIQDEEIRYTARGEGLVTFYIKSKLGTLALGHVHMAQSSPSSLQRQPRLGVWLRGCLATCLITHSVTFTLRGRPPHQAPGGPHRAPALQGLSSEWSHLTSALETHYKSPFNCTSLRSDKPPSRRTGFRFQK